MRGLIEGLTTSAPLADTLPSMLREDPFARQLCAGLDDVLAPVLASLDSFSAYLDLATTPDDMLPWLAQWVGISVDPSKDHATQRQLLAAARDLHAVRGTRAGIGMAVATAFGVEVDVFETGGCTWSQIANDDLPGESQPAVVVVARPSAGQELDVERVEAVVRSAVPAHVRCEVRITEG